MIKTSISIEVSKSRIRNSILMGALTYIIGFLLAVVTPSSGPGPTIVQAGFKFYNAHLTDYVFRRRADADPVNRLIDFTSSNEQAAWLVVPVILLLVGGALATMVSENVNTETAVVTGSLITLGYFPLIVFGARLIQYENYIVDLSTAAGVGGLTYPVVFGGLGGYFYAKLR